MIIGIDARIPVSKKTGIGYMLSNLIPEMIKIDKKNNYKIFGHKIDIDDNNTKIYRLPKIFQRAFNLLWKVIRFPVANIIFGKADIFFFTNFVDFPVIARKKILMIPDMSFRVYPQFTERKNLRFLERGVLSSIKRADKILTISENAKKEICSFYHTSTEKVEVIYLGCPNNVKVVNDLDKIEKIKNKYSIPGKYILTMGTIEPRKNLKELIKAYNKLDDGIKDEYSLVLSGGKGWYYEEIFGIVNDMGLQERVLFTGYVDEDDVSSIYSGASLFVFPSIYEGFGLPILEAFNCGVPVLCSSSSSIPEVGGDAVMYCDPASADSIRDGIKMILADKDLSSELVEKGYEQAKKFSWKDSAKKIVEIINNL